MRSRLGLGLLALSAVVILLALAGCGGSVGSVGQTQEQRAAEQALKLWSGFPAARDPRPVVLISQGSVLDPKTGFPTGDAKLAYLQGHFVLRVTLPKTPSQFHGRPVISARRALKLLSSNSGPGPPTSPLEITHVKLGWASFSTERGLRTLPAWAFSLVGVKDPTYVLALTGSGVFTPPATKQLMASEVGGGYEEDHAAVSRNGRVIRLTFVGGPAGHRPCDISYAAGSLADSHAVAFWLTEHPVRTHVACIALGYNRTVTIHLDKPLGARVLIDAASAGVVPVAGAQ
jgi:hypothetical protein